MTTPCLEIKQVSKSFGGLMALMNVSVNVSPSQIKSIIGPNGSGKTTIFNIITGFISASCGSVL
jgi:ABC-type branched-subunit amino acid transport system ATPase component